MTAILPIGIPVGSKFFSTAFAGEAIDRIRALSNLVAVLIPPLSPAGIIAKVLFSSDVRLIE